MITHINYSFINKNRILSTSKKHNYIKIFKAEKIIYANCKTIVSIKRKTQEIMKESIYADIDAHEYTGIHISARVHTHTYTLKEK